jgi:hypothetical protein
MTVIENQLVRKCPFSPSEGTVTHYCGALKGIIEGGLQHLFSL